VAALAERAGTGFRCIEYLKVAFPLILVSNVTSHVYLYARYL
jgi:Na+/H+ antiporter NhaD/arsenite permease-like protein